ncbi:nuclear pore complex protein Nup153 isoform X2 [Diabrotica virgifera virgifera]|uniref:Nuclear pore complex protein Nup153 n=1 Tax=Diabrotica virgifera virgifera TaxID=50390 RepID=A0A6P7FM35_DIAVI|nr:nuclear pore complex protein Nup153 isoform X2 [Diabrotica virgifera virgifera]
MAKDYNSSGDQGSPYSNQEDTEQSFVGKVKSIISNTPLRRWFGRQDDSVKPTIRRREEDDSEDDTEQFRPPAKRAKFVVSREDVSVSHIKSSDSIKDKLLINRNYSFLEPVAGPSGLQTRNLLNNVNSSINSDINVQLFSSDFLNGHKDSDSEESTSGYSSVARIGSKEHVCQSEGSSKQPSPRQTTSPNRRSLFETPTVNMANRSLFVDRTASPQLSTSMSLRRPQFNASTFGSPNFFDQTLSTEKVISSPFYSGSTMYGGASAYGNKFGRRVKDFRANLKRSVHIKPIKKTSENGNLVLGKTARKILETIEQYTTPVNDAKKIPVASKRARLDSSLLGQHIGAKPYTLIPENASKRELQVPTVSELLKMKQKAKLQSSTEAVRQIATTSKSDLNTVQQPSPTNTSKVETPPKVVDTPKTFATTLQKFDSSKKIETVVTSKISQSIEAPKLTETPKVTKAVSKPETSKKTEVIPQKNTNIQKVENTTKEKSNILPSLPITTPLNKSDSLTSSAIKKTVEKVPEISVTTTPMKPQNSQTSLGIGGIKKTNQKEQTLTTQFKFSDPLVVAENLNSIIAINNFKFSEPLTNLNKTEKSSKSFKEKNNGQSNSKDISSNTSLLDKFKPASGTWECSTCLIRNSQDKTKCIACETPKVKPAQIESTKTSFGDKFKMPENMWECPTCMIRNASDCAKCVACETPNPKAGSLVTSSSNSLGKFKPPTNSWECSTCLVRNKAEHEKCVACENPRVAKIDVMDSFKKKADEWTCEVCMVRNQMDRSKCQCCEALKPGAPKPTAQETGKLSTTKYNFGLDKTATTQFKFGIQPIATGESTLTKVPTPVGTETKLNSSTTPTFSFGVKPSTEKKPEVEPPQPGGSKAVAVVSGTVLPEKTSSTISTFAKPEEKTALPTVAAAKELSTAPTAAVNDLNSASHKPAFSFAADKSKPIAKFEFSKPAVPAATNSVEPPPNKVIKSSLNPGFSFGKAVNSAGASTAPVFGQNTPSATPVFGQDTATSQSTFGQNSSTGITLFGQNKSSSSTSGNNGIDAKPAPAFGIPAKPAVDLPPTNTTVSKSFSFTKPNVEPATNAPVFNFGQSASQAVSAATTQSSGFSFGQAAKAPVFSFTGAKTDSGSTTNMFSAAGKNGPFNFGGSSQNADTQKAGFNFGASSTTPTPAFNMTPTQPAAHAAPSGGFNFFDANAKPTFNFSAGTTPVFTAPGDAAPPRKIKKAVRRTTQR